jgi:hypothetical protein
MPDGKPVATFPGIAGVFSQCRTENRLPLFLALLVYFRNAGRKTGCHFSWHCC